MNNRDIYLVFSKSGTWLSRLISVVTGLKYPHCAISFDSTFTKMYTFGRVNADNPFSGGFVAESIYDGVYKKYSNCKCLIYKLKITQEQYILLEKEIGKFKKDEKIYRYNFLGLFGVLFNKPIKRNNHYFCSQFVSIVLMNSRIYYNDKKPELIRTNELLNIDNMEMIYEGIIDSGDNSVSLHNFVKGYI